MQINNSNKRRRLSKHAALSIDAQHYEYENEYDKWKSSQPPIIVDFSIDSSGTFYWSWSLMVVIGCLYNLIILTVLAFENVRETYFEQWTLVNVSFDIIFVIDIVIQSKLSFYEQGVMIKDFSETSQNYLKSYYFLIDILSILPIDLFFVKKSTSAFCRINRFLKFYRTAQFIALSYGKLSQVTISLSQILISCFLLFHCNACVFYIISVNSDTSGWDGVNATFDDDEMLPWPYMPEKITDTYFIACDGHRDCYNKEFYFDEEREEHLIELYQHWMTGNRSKRLHFSQFTKEYTVSMYWSAMTMTTLGEQPAPDTSIQNVFEVLNTIVGLLLFAVIMGSIGDLVANANKVKTYWQSLMDGLKQYMTYRSLNAELQTKVLKYCEYEMAAETILKEHQVREELPSKLYANVTKSIIGKSLLKSPIFRASEKSFLNEISEFIEPHYFSPGDVVVEKGQHCTYMLIIVSGKIIEVVDNEETGLHDEIEHTEGDVLFDSNLIWFENHLSNNRHQRNFVSNAFSQIHMLCRDDFLNVLEAYGATLKKKLCDIAYSMQKRTGQLNDLKKKLVDTENIEENFKSLHKTTKAIEKRLYVCENHFQIFTSSTKRRLYNAEQQMCKLIKHQRRRHSSFINREGIDF